MRKFSRVVFFAFSLLSAVAAHATAPTITSLSLVQGSAGGGTTLHVYGADFGTPGTSAVSVLVGAEYCQNTLLVAAGDIQCQMPVGVPGSMVEIAVYVDGVVSSNTLPFDYLPRPQLQSPKVLTGYSNNGAPILNPNGAMGSAGGGDTLLIGSSNFGFLNYAPWQGQPRDLKVYVGGNECLNPVLHWNDVLAGVFAMGNTISCTTPAGTPADYDAEIKLFINGVQDQQSAQCNGCGYFFDYLPRPQLQQVKVVTGYGSNGAPILNPSGTMGSAGGGETLLIRDFNSIFWNYAPWQGQPRDVKVYVGGNECLNPVLHWDDNFSNAFGQGNTITCVTPIGAPNSNAEIKLFINGVQDSQSTQCNGCGYLFDYFPRPQLQQVAVVTGYDNGGAPMWDTYARGSAAGGDTLVLRDSSSSFWNYAPWQGQPRDFTVFVGGNECLNPVLHWDDSFSNVFGPGNAITCTTPAGTPGDYNAEVELFINGVQDQLSAACNGCGYVFEYWQHPTINGVDRLVLDPGTGTEITDGMLEGSPAGGTRLQIDLSHEFRLGSVSNWQVMIGAVPCNNVQYAAGNQSITCFTPAGSAGSVAPVRVWQDGMPANENDPVVFNFQYRELPQMSQLSPAFGFAGGGSTLVVEGNFFADAFSQIAVRVGNNLCGNATLVNPTMIECTLPRGVVDTTVPVTVSIDGANTPTPNALLFTYDAAPQLTLLAPDHGPLSGGNLLEIEGAYFSNFVGGMSLSVPMVLVGNKLCSNPVFTDETHLVCIVPSSVTATTVNVSVFVDGIAAGNKLPYTYAAPVFSDITPAEGLPAGGYPVVISGSDLGVPGQTSVAVKIGTQYCSGPVLVSDTAISCTMPAGTGSNLPVTVYLNGQAKITGLAFSYVTPVPVLQSVTPAQGLASGGTLITLSGSHFGTIGASVLVGNSACTVQSQTEEEIVCSTTAGNAGMQPLTVTVEGNTSNALLFEYTGAMPLNGIFRGSSVQENTGAQ